MRLSVLYDNRATRADLSAAWGFSCLVDEGLLFDTGGDGSRLLANAERMGLELAEVRSVVLSHAHGDHSGGLATVLAHADDCAVCLPGPLRRGAVEELSRRARVVVATEPTEVAPGVRTTGSMVGRDGIVEQGLVVESGRGPTLLTGCAHPGLLELLRRGEEEAGRPIRAVVGGFHMEWAAGAEVEAVIAGLQGSGVERVAPCHCTGDRAIQAFAAAFGEGFVAVGVGTVLELG